MKPARALAEAAAWALRVKFWLRQGGVWTVLLLAAVAIMVASMLALLAISPVAGSIKSVGSVVLLSLIFSAATRGRQTWFANQGKPGKQRIEARIAQIRGEAAARKEKEELLAVVAERQDERPSEASQLPTKKRINRL